MNIISIIIAIILFSIIVIFHELGHFWLAKANGIKVNEFCLGLGPTLFGVQRGETKYSIKLLPFGGACIMEVRMKAQVMTGHSTTNPCGRA